MKSVEKYRFYDLVTLAVLGIILEVLCIRFTGGMASFSLAISIIAIIRWRRWGLSVAALTGLGTVIGIQMRGFDLNVLMYEFLIYVVGNLGIVLTCICIEKFDKKNSKKTFEILLLYAIISYIGQSFCRGLIVTMYVNDFTAYCNPIYGNIDVYQYLYSGSLYQWLEILRYSFVNGIVGNFLMPIIVAGVVLTITSKIDGILVDPIEYIIQQREEAKRSYEVFEKFNLPDEPEEDVENKQDKEVDEDERVSN